MTEQQQTAVDRLVQIARDTYAEYLAKSTIERVPSTHEAESYPWGETVQNKHYDSSVEVSLDDIPAQTDIYVDSMRLLGFNAAMTGEVPYLDAQQREHIGEAKIVGTPFIQERSAPSFSVSEDGGVVRITATWRGALAYRPATA